MGEDTYIETSSKNLSTLLEHKGVVLGLVWDTPDAWPINLKGVSVEKLTVFVKRVYRICLYNFNNVILIVGIARTWG